MDEQKFYLDTIEQAVDAGQTNKDTIEALFFEFLELEHLYESAAEIVKTQLNIYDNEFSMKFQRNPIHGIESRIKRIQERIDEYNEDIDSLNGDLHEKKKKDNILIITKIAI
mgnify:CR=1 FL=1